MEATRYFENPARESPTTSHAQTVRINPPQLRFLNFADENNGIQSLVLLGQGLPSLALFRQGLDDLAGQAESYSDRVFKLSLIRAGFEIFDA